MAPAASQNLIPSSEWPHASPATTLEPARSFTFERTTNSHVQQLAAKWFKFASVAQRTFSTKKEGSTQLDLPLFKRICSSAGLFEQLQQIVARYPLAFLCKRENDTCGLVLATVEEDLLEVTWLAANPNRFTGSGVKGAGTYLLSMIERVGITLGAGLCELEALETATSFYAERGYIALDPKMPRLLSKDLTDVPPLSSTPTLHVPVQYTPHTPTIVLEEDVTEEMYDLLAIRVGDATHTDLISDLIFANKERLQLLAVFDDFDPEETTHPLELEALFLINVDNPDVLKVTVAIDSTPGKVASYKALEVFTRYAAYCGREPKCDLLLLPNSKRGRE